MYGVVYVVFNIIWYYVGWREKLLYEVLDWDNKPLVACIYGAVCILVLCPLFALLHLFVYRCVPTGVSSALVVGDSKRLAFRSHWVGSSLHASCAAGNISRQKRLRAFRFCVAGMLAVDTTVGLPLFWARNPLFWLFPRHTRLHSSSVCRLYSARIAPRLVALPRSYLRSIRPCHDSSTTPGLVCLLP